MNANQIVDSLINRKGRNVRVTWRRPLKTYKGVDILLEKETTVFVRAGIDYANLSNVKNEIAIGQRGEVEPLPWGTWETFPFIIEHKGAKYVRLYPASFENLRKPSVRYYAGGALTNDIENIRELCLASEFNERERGNCFTVKEQDVIKIED